MQNRNLFFVTNDFKINKSFIDSLIDNPESSETDYPFKLPNNNVVDKLVDLVSCNHDYLVIDFFKYIREKIVNSFIIDKDNISKDTITELCNEQNTEANYGAIKNLNKLLFPVEYFYQYVIANSKDYNDDGSTDDCPNGYTKDNIISLSDDYNLKEYTIKFIYISLNTFINSHNLLPINTIKHYDKVTQIITYIVDNFYSFIFNEIFSRYNKKDDFYKTVLLIKNVAIPLLILDLFAFVRSYKMEFFTKSILSNIINITGLTVMNYKDAFYMIHSVDNRTFQFKSIIIMNSPFIKEDLVNGYNLLYDEFQNITFIKLVNDSKHDNLLSTISEKVYPGFNTYFWTVYSLYHRFDLFFFYNDSLDLNDDQTDSIKKILCSISLDNSQRMVNYSVLDPKIGIIDYDQTNNKNNNNFYVVDKLNNIDNIKSESLGLYFKYAYCMNEDITRDDLTDYLDNHTLPSNFEFLIDLDTLNLDYRSDPDDFNDYITKLKSYNILVSCLLDTQKVTYNDINFYLETFYNIGFKINNINDILVLKFPYYPRSWMFTAFIKDKSLNIEQYLTLKSTMTYHNKIKEVISYY